MGKTNSKWLIPSIGGMIALCVACACCAAVGLYFYGDQIIANLNTPTTNNPSTEIPVLQPTIDTTPCLRRFSCTSSSTHFHIYLHAARRTMTYYR